MMAVTVTMIFEQQLKQQHSASLSLLNARFIQADLSATKSDRWVGPTKQYRSTCRADACRAFFFYEPLHIYRHVGQLSADFLCRSHFVTDKSASVNRSLVVGRDVNKATDSQAKAPFLKTKACQLNHKDTPRPRPCSPKARPRPQLDQANNFSVKHKKILCKSDTDKREHNIH